MYVNERFHRSLTTSIAPALVPVMGVGFTSAITNTCTMNTVLKSARQEIIRIDLCGMKYAAKYAVGFTMEVKVTVKW